jgi:hypothetical protein
MAKIIDGMIMGVRMYGEVTMDDMRNFGEFTLALDNLKKSLAKMFDDKIADMVMKNILSDTRITVSDGEVENEEMWERLVAMGIVSKKEHGCKAVTNRMMIEVM